MKPYEMLAGMNSGVGTLTPEATRAARDGAPLKSADGGVSQGRKPYEIMPPWSVATATSGVPAARMPKGFDGGWVQSGGMPGSLAGVSGVVPFRQPKAYEIMPASFARATTGMKRSGCGCEGKCGHCGRLGFPFNTPKLLLLNGPTSFDADFRPSVREGGMTPSTCTLIQQEIDGLIAEFRQQQNRCNAIRTAYFNCRSGQPIDCYSYEVENRIIEGELRVLGEQWNEAGEGPEGDRRRRSIDDRRAAIADYREHVLSPAWQLCAMTGNRDINARARECVRLRRQLQDCSNSYRGLGDYILRAFENYRAYARRIGCAINPGLATDMEDTVEEYRNTESTYRMEFDLPNGEFLTYSFSDFIIYEIPF